MTTKEMLGFLIAELSPSASIPDAEEQQWRLFRSLVNQREPRLASERFLRVQDQLLQRLIDQKGITDAADLTAQGKLCLWRGDITTLKVDAIVNAANSGMVGCFAPCHACIDNAIHTFAGVQLRLECAQIMRQQGHPEPTGVAKLTRAYNLPSNYVLHTVGPIVTGALTDREERLLASCYRACLALAERQGDIESVAFCCISTGEFRFPNQAAAEIALRTVTECLADCNRIKKVIFNVFTERDQRIYEGLLGSLA